MDVILIPGFWLRGDTWGPVPGVLGDAGHTVHTPTLPGKESPDAVRAGIGLRDHIEYVIRLVDGIEGPVALVGHSGGGAIAHGVADARPDRVARVVYVDAVPLGDGRCINDELPAVGDDVPLPDWDVFDDEDLVDLTEELRERLRAIAVPEPVGVAQQPIELHDDRRYDAPVTVICCEFPSGMLQQLIADGHGYTAELGRMRDVRWVDLPTGHWPQFTKPDELAVAIRDALAA